MTIKLELDNGEPFNDPVERERILRGIAHGNRAGAIRDSDGNRIGHYELSERVIVASVPAYDWTAIEKAKKEQEA